MKQTKNTHNGVCKKYNKAIYSDEHVLEKIQYTILNQVKKIIQNTRENIKFYVTLEIVFEKSNEPEIKTDPPIYLSSNPFNTTNPTGLNITMQKIYEELYASIETFEKNGSNWVIFKVNNISLTVVKYKPIRASSYLSLPKFFQKYSSSSILNLQNFDDEKCAIWCLVAHQYPQFENRADSQVRQKKNPIMKKISINFLII